MEQNPQENPQNSRKSDEDMQIDTGSSLVDKFEMRYFPIEDVGEDPQQIDSKQSNESNRQVFVQVERTFTKKEMQIIEESNMGEKKEKKKPQVSESQLFIFADQSGSMGGAPFEAVKQACLLMAESIFGDGQGDGPFAKVHLVFYCHILSPTVHYNKQTFVAEVNR